MPDNRVKQMAISFLTFFYAHLYRALQRCDFGYAAVAVRPALRLVLR